MSEYIYTDLPRYVKTTPRENFANSVVKDGAVLLFSEDGETLVAKHPDGSFTEISSGGGSAEFYKCASVDTSAKTWTGYKAVFADGAYSFESAVTEGLTYTSVTPVVDSIYSADALVAVKNLYSGALMPDVAPVIYASLETALEPEIGTKLEGTSALFNTVDGVPCAELNNIWLRYLPDGWTTLNYNQGSLTVSMMLYLPAELANLQPVVRGTASVWGLTIRNNQIGLTLNGNTFAIEGAVLELNKWYHAAITYDASTYTHALYFNGAKVGQRSGKLEFSSNDFKLVKNPWLGSSGTLNAAAFRVYDSVLAPEYIDGLAHEFSVIEN